MTPVADSACSFTQLAWDDTQKVGMAAAYREDSRTTYVVAYFTPSGNFGDVRNYLKHVKQPTAGGKSTSLPLIFQYKVFSVEETSSNGIHKNKAVQYFTWERGRVK